MKKNLTFLFHLGLVSVFTLILSSCNWNDDPKPSKERGWTKEIYEAMQEIYLWNDALPATFDPTKYATSEDALKYLIGLKIDPNTRNPIDRYSFLDKIGGISGEIQLGVAGDYGFMVKYPSNEAGTYPYVVYVYKNSPAGLAKLYRGLKLIKIGNNNVTLDGSSSGGAGLDNVINALYSTTSSSFTFEKQDGSTATVNLSVIDYKKNSVLLDTVYTQDSKKIGYLAFNEFLDAPSMLELRKSFSEFEKENISELIVDLRYNRGGSVQTCDSLSSMIAPSLASNQIMNYTIYNKLLTDYFTSKYGSDFFITRFKKEGAINLQRIFFIVSKSTASASELLINNLKPYMDVKLIGANTYGKPCGFWATPIGYSKDQGTPKEGYDLYAISFETQNANREGGYYTGMVVNKEVPDGVLFSWGDINENRLSEALYYIKNGSFKPTTKALTKDKSIDISRQFRGMIDFRKRLK